MKENNSLLLVFMSVVEPILYRLIDYPHGGRLGLIYLKLGERAMQGIQQNLRQATTIGAEGRKVIVIAFSLLEFFLNFSQLSIESYIKL